MDELTSGTWGPGLPAGLRGADLRQSSAAFLAEHGCAATADHCARVAAQAVQLAARFGADAAAAEACGLLHDISAVIPDERRIAAAEAWHVALLDEERAYPMIIHQKLSACIAADVFGVTDRDALSAIGCHTTLKFGASVLDKVVFVADKLAWDQPGTPPYLAALCAAVERGLDAAALCYLDYLWERRAALKCIHPWFVAARAELRGERTGAASTATA